MRRRQITVLLALAGLATPAGAGWKDLVNQAGKALGGAAGAPAAPGSGATAAAALSNDQIVAALKEALAQGAERAVAALGRRDGFLGNAAVRIPVPERLRSVTDLARRFGQGRYVDELETTLNRAAESAVPEAAPILGDAIRSLTVAEGRRILSGPDDAATRYFRRVGGERLAERLLPIVRQATAGNGVTAALKRLLGAAGPAAAMLGAESLDLDRYVTDKALDGLFLMVAAEEKRIRENPAARSTDLLKRVFGSVAR